MLHSIAKGYQIRWQTESQSAGNCQELAVSTLLVTWFNKYTQQLLLNLALKVKEKLLNWLSDIKFLRSDYT